MAASDCDHSGHSAAPENEMEKLPKIALQRLRQGTAGAIPEAGAAEHPDADLLTAFAEKKLTSRERASVMSHLAKCETCREVVALTCLPIAEEAPPVKEAGPRVAWFRIPIVRWGAVTAALGAILITVILQRRVIQPVHEPAIAERKQLSPPEPAPPAARAEPEASVPAATRDQTDALRVKAPARSEVSSSPLNINQPTEKQGGAAGEVARTLEPSVTLSSKAAPAQAGPSAGNTVGGSVPLASPATAAVPSAEQSAAAMKPTGAEIARAQTRAAEAAKDKLDAAAESRKKASIAGVQQAEGAPRPQALLKSGGPLLAPVAKKRAGVPSPFVRWSISNTGKVQRSLDSGTTWEELDVNDSLVFRVVTTAGNEVWAGGARGALYHSVDGGEHWTRVYLDLDQSGPDDAIVGITFTDPLHGRVTTAADERWITTDGGRHWARGE